MQFRNFLENLYIFFEIHIPRHPILFCWYKLCPKYLLDKFRVTEFRTLLFPKKKTNKKEDIFKVLKRRLNVKQAARHVRRLRARFGQKAKNAKNKKRAQNTESLQKNFIRFSKRYRKTYRPISLSNKMRTCDDYLRV